MSEEAKRGLMRAESNELPSTFTLNGNQQLLIGSPSVNDLLEQLGYVGKRVAVELNGDVVPKSQYFSRQINVGDRFEIVVAVGGG